MLAFFSLFFSFFLVGKDTAPVYSHQEFVGSSVPLQSRLTREISHADLARGRPVMGDSGEVATMVDAIADVEVAPLGGRRRLLVRRRDENQITGGAGMILTLCSDHLTGVITYGSHSFDSPGLGHRDSNDAPVYLTLDWMSISD